MPKRVVFVAGRLAHDGVTRWIRTLAGRLDRSRWEPTVVVGERADQAVAAGFGVDGIPVVVVGSGSLGDGVALIGGMNRVVGSLAPSLLVVSNRKLDLPLRVLGVLHKSRVVSAYHTIRQRVPRVLAGLDTATTGMTVGRIAISTTVAQSYGMNEGPATAVIPHGVGRLSAAQGRQEVRRELGVPAETRVFLCVGRFSGAAKNHLALVDGFSRHVGRGGEGVLVLVGDGPLAGPVRAAVARQGLDARVRFVPGSADVGSFYQAADVYIQPSLWEGFGLTVAEAMSYAVPVMASRILAFEEVLGDTAAAWFDPQDAEAIADAFGKASRLPPADLTRFGTASQARQRRLFTEDLMVARYDDVFTRWAV